MRGKVQDETQQGLWTGITPAYAGKRTLFFVHYAKGRDHPRVCGEKLPFHRAHFAILGSPPRMRGKAQSVTLAALEGRITPAYAGKRVSEFGKLVSAGDHPRVCGEKPQCCPAGSYCQGSPPRMRGKDSENRFAENPQGITPAYAGKSPQAMSRGGFFRGSPPRMRGKACPAWRRYAAKGITPAYAGKSYACKVRHKV